MRLRRAVAGGMVLGAARWWFQREPSPGAHDHAAAPALYRWRDDAGRLQVTGTTPAGRPAERVARGGGGIQVRGDR